MDTQGHFQTNVEEDNSCCIYQSRDSSTWPRGTPFVQNHNTQFQTEEKPANESTGTKTQNISGTPTDPMPDESMENTPMPTIPPTLSVVKAKEQHGKEVYCVKLASDPL